MKNTDFIDEDLLQTADAVRKRMAGRGVGDGSSDADEEDRDVPVQTISEFNLGRMAKHKEEVSGNVIGAMNEIERLRRRQQQLEQERRALEELATKQDEYERGKRELIEHLNEGITALEKKEIRASQLVDLMVATRGRFKETLAEIEAIDEDKWADERFREELNKALLVVDDARIDYNKALAKIEVLEGNRESIMDTRPMAATPAAAVRGGDRSFLQWVKIGLACSLPVLIVALLAMAAYLVLLRLCFL